MARVEQEIKVTLQSWRVRMCLMALWFVAWLPSGDLRDRIAERLLPLFARWIVRGAKVQ